MRDLACRQVDLLRRARGPRADGGRRAARCAASGIAALTALSVAAVVGPAVPASAQPTRVPRSGQSAQATLPEHSAHAADAKAPMRGIILPDLLVVMPRGLTERQVRRLSRIPGVRDLIAFDGARITVGSGRGGRARPVNVIGVDPAAFRSWVPLRTASAQAIWKALAGGSFISSAPAARRLGLRPGNRYRLSGARAEVARFGGAVSLGIDGIDLVVNRAEGARLGLIHRVAALLSAPGVAMARLVRQVKAVTGRSAATVDLRPPPAPAPPVGYADSQPPAVTAPGVDRTGAASRQPGNYLQLFKASAAMYCPGLSWTVLAAIGQIESNDGQNVGPSSAGALGPMQFLPSTWAVWGIDAFGQTGPPDVMNPYDAVPSAARLLCADGATDGPQGLTQAIWDYNHADWYVREVLALAAAYAAQYR